MSALENIKTVLKGNHKHPVYSASTTALSTAIFAPAAFGIGGATTLYAGYVSPAVTALNTVIAGVDIVRPNRSILSKAFSVAAAATGVASGVAFANTVGNGGGWIGLDGIFDAFMYTSAGMVATSALNTVAHYTRDVGAKIGLKVENQEPDVVFTTRRQKPEDTQQTPRTSFQSIEM